MRRPISLDLCLFQVRFWALLSIVLVALLVLDGESCSANEYVLCMYVFDMRDKVAVMTIWT